MHRLSLQSLFGKNPFLLTLFAVFVPLAANCLRFTYHATEPYIQADVFRHLEQIVIPVIEGTGGLSLLWSNQHPSPVLHLIQMANLAFFGFRLDYHAYLGVLFQLATTALLLYMALSTTGKGRQNRLPGEYLVLVFFVAIALGFNTLRQYTWPLMGTVQYLYFFGVVLLLFADRAIADDSWRKLLVFLFAAFILMFANIDYGTIFIGALSTSLALAFAVGRQKKHLRVNAALLITWLAYWVMMRLILPEGPFRPSSAVLQVLSHMIYHPLDSVLKISIALTGGLVNIDLVRRHLPGAEIFIVILSPLVLLAFLIAFVLNFTRRLYDISVAPLSLMLIAGVMTAAIFLNRYWLLTDHWSLATDRYEPTYRLAILGMIWSYWLVMARPTPLAASAASTVLKKTTATVVALLLLLQGWQLAKGWDSVPTKRMKNNSYALGIYLAGTKGSTKIPDSVVSHEPGRSFEDVIDYLAKNKLNVFSPRYPKRGAFANYIKSEKLFSAESPEPTINLLERSSGTFYTPNKIVFATWESTQEGVLIRSEYNLPIYAELTIVVTPFDGLPPILSAESSGPSFYMFLFEGKQKLYFSIGENSSYQFRLKSPHKITALQVRRENAYK